MKKFLFACTCVLVLGGLKSQVAHGQAFTAPAPKSMNIDFIRVSEDPKPQEKPSAAIDLEMTSIDRPFSSCGLGSAETVVVTVTNKGTDTIKGFSVSYQIGTGAIDTEAVAEDLAPGKSYQYAFAQKADLSAIKTHNVKAAAIATGDGVSTNNSKSASVATTHSAYLDSASVITSFEVADDATLFTQKDNNNDGATWAYDTRFPRSGKRSMSCYVGSTRKNDDWLFSKCLELKAGQKYDVSFYYLANTGSAITGKIFVMLGRQAIPASMKDTLFVDSAVTGTSFREAKITFQVEEDGGYTLGLREASTSTVAPPGGSLFYGVTIDDFNMTKDRSIAVLVSDIKYPRTDCDLANNTPIVVSLANKGTTDQSNFTVSFKVGSKPAVTETYTQTLKAGESADYTFNTLANNLSISAENKLQAFTSLSVKGEEFKQNVKKIDPAYLDEDTSTFQNRFETEDAMVGWDIADANLDGEKWTRAYEGGVTVNHAMVFPGAGDFNNDADDWVFSSCASLEAGKSYALVFDYSINAVDPGSAPSFTINMGSLQRPDGMTQELGVYDQSTDGEYITDEPIDCITVPETGTYYFGIHTLAPAQSGAIRFDNFNLQNSDCVVGVSKIRRNDLARVFPNPANTELNVALTLSSSETAVVSLVDVLGKVIFNQSIEGATTDRVKIETSALSEGMYFVRVQSTSGTTVKKVMIKR